MTNIRKFIAALLSVPLLLLAAAPSVAQAQRSFSQAELDRMLAPVALYPDPLLSQVLMAATYPAEVVEAARWSRANPHLTGDAAVRAADGQDWDPSVMSLLAFPHLLQRMDENLAWTRSLGAAFLAQEPHVMETVQQLRRRAYASGNLRSDERLLVQPQGQTIVLAPVQPQVVYVPYYDPLVVYGPWWWPAYQPVYWAPWPGYALAHRPGMSVSFWWGSPVSISTGFFYGDMDWHHRHVRVVHVHSYYVHHHRHPHLAPGHWRRVAAPRARPVEQPRARPETRTSAQPERPQPRPAPLAEPRRETPRVEVPKVEAPKVEAPKAAVPIGERPRERPQTQTHVPAPRPEARPDPRPAKPG